MGWLLGWLIFGLLAAYESGELALNGGGEWGPVRALGFLLLSAIGLGVIAWRAVAHARPSALRAVWLISLLALAVSLWRLYGGPAGNWVTAALFGAAYAALCLLAATVSMFIAWRRHRAHEARVAHARAERDRQHRMDGVRAQGAALTTASAGLDADGLDADGDFVLPSRPKWEES